MAVFSSERARAFYAETYDTVVPDWPGEIDFYRAGAAEATTKGLSILEVACGTGRVTIRLARAGGDFLGLDLSEAMLAVAREKSRGMDNLRWVQGDMRSFDLGATFGLIIIPGHSFQNLPSADDHVAALQNIKRHLVPGGALIVHLDHQDLGWLGGITGDKGGVFEPGKAFTHPKTGQQIRTACAWSYAPATQIASLQQIWEALDARAEVGERWESGTLQFHCMFRFEMEHLLKRTGFSIEAVYGDFARGELKDNSFEMIWVARMS